MKIMICFLNERRTEFFEEDELTLGWDTCIILMEVECKYVLMKW